MNCVLKKFVVKTINKVLNDYKTNVAASREAVSLWTSRTRKLLECLESLLAKLDDNQLDDKELEEAVKSIENLVKGW